MIISDFSYIVYNNFLLYASVLLVFFVLLCFLNKKKLLMQFDAIFFNKFKHEKNLKILETNPHGS
jgi:hypothetical protein